MRIGFVCTRFFPPDGVVSGIEVFVRTLAERLQRLGHEPVVIAAAPPGWRGPAPDRVGDIPVYRFAESRIRPRRFTLRLQYQEMAKRIASVERLDLVECCDEGGMLLKKGFDCPLVVRMHQNGSVRLRLMGRPLSATGDVFERRLLRMADLRIGVSHWVARITLETAGLEHLDYRVIYNGVDPALFAPARGETADADVILYAGQLNDRKGLDVLFAALPTIMQHHPAAKLRCVGANRGHPPPAERYMSMVPLQLKSRVDFAGEIPHDRMPHEFRRAGLCVFPSRAEGHPLAVIEAMACRAPVIFMKDGVGPEVITHGVDGLLCDTTDPGSLASTILEALSSPDLRHSLGVQARRTAEDRFSLDKSTEENLAVYRQLVNTRGARGEAAARAAATVARPTGPFPGGTVDSSKTERE